MIKHCIYNAIELISMAVLSALLAVSVTRFSPPTAIAADAPQSVVRIDEQRLTGRWVRPDGGYILELTEIRKNGTLKAAYFNRRPIKVSKAEFKSKDGTLTVFVELRDVNYPGSKYNLQYDPESDRLTGTYFQAVEKQTYDIEFMRAR